MGPDTVCVLLFALSGTFAFAGFVASLLASGDRPRRSRIAETPDEDPRVKPQGLMDDGQEG